MTYHVEIKQEPDQLVASIRRRVEPARIGEVVPQALRRLSDLVSETGMGHGMPGLVMHGMRQREADLEVFVPVVERFDPPEGVEVGILEGGTMAATIHTGPYDASGSAYEAVMTWIDDRGRHPAGPPRERYLNDPHVVGLDRAETEIEVPMT